MCAFICIMVSSAFVMGAASASQIDNSAETIVESYWFDSEGNRITDEALIDSLENMSTVKERGAICCDEMHKITYYNEEHTYIGSLPAWCFYDVIRVVRCTACGAEWSRDVSGPFKHYHT